MGETFTLQCSEVKWVDEEELEVEEDVLWPC